MALPDLNQLAHEEMPAFIAARRFALNQPKWQPIFPNGTIDYDWILVCCYRRFQERQSLEHCVWIIRQERKLIDPSFNEPEPP